MLCDPESKHVLAVEPMEKPENNDVVTRSLEAVLPLYKKCNAFIMDRACAFYRAGVQNPNLAKIRHYAVDKMHEKGHSASCKQSPKKSPTLKRRLRQVNTHICEQTFAWFRGFARVLNTMRPNRHYLAVLVFAAKHNELMRQKETEHLATPGTPRGKRQRPYGCGRSTKLASLNKKPAASSSKAPLAKRPAGKEARGAPPKASRWQNEKEATALSAPATACWAEARVAPTAV